MRQLTLQPRLAEVGRARRFLREIGEGGGLAPEKVFDVTVACSEALANAIEHSASKSQTRLKTLLYPDRLEVQIEGAGKFHPPRSGRDRAHRGLGLPLMAYLSDHLALYSGPRGGTLVSMTFYRGEAPRQGQEAILPPTILELIEENELTSVIVNTVPLGICVLDPGLQLRWANPALLSFLDSVSSEGHMGAASLPARLPLSAELAVAEALRAVSNTGVADQWREAELEGVDGRPRWWRTAALPLFGDRTEPPYDVLLVVADQTDSKLHELERDRLARELTKRAGEVQALLDVSPVAIWFAHDPQCAFMTGNLRAEEYLGPNEERRGNQSLSAPEIAGRASYSVWRDGVELTPDQLPAQRCCATGRPVSDQQLEIRFRDGRMLDVIMNSVPLFDEDGRVRGSVTVGADVTQLARTNEVLSAKNRELEQANEAILQREEALRASESHFRGLAEAMPQIVWTAGADGGIEWFNQQWYRYTGGSPRDAEGWGWSAEIHPDDREPTMQCWKEALRRQDTYQHEARFRRHDGTYRWFLLRAWPLRDAEDTVLQWFRTQTDVDEMKQAAEALRASNDELQRFNRAAVDRELRMLELKREVNVLDVAAGKPPRYSLHTELDAREGEEHGR